MRTLIFLSLVVCSVACVPEDEERCYNVGDSDRPSGSHLVLNEATGKCERVDGTDASTKDASLDATPDADAECSESNACTDRSNARCNAGACEQCTDHSHCQQFSSSPVCSGGKCIECAANAQCDSPLASRCFAGNCTRCESDGDCSHIPGKGVCHENQCVECTSEKDAACTGVCVIEPLTDQQSAFTCDDTLEEKVGDCEPCVATKHCQAGRACVPMKSDDTELGNFCQWLLSEAPNTSCAQVLPYSKVVELTPIEGGDPMSVCSLRLSTCQALTDFSIEDCMTLDEQGNDLCGVEGVEDGYCINRTGFGPRCSVPCGELADDCPSEAGSCNSVESRPDIGAQKVCLF